MDFRLTDDQRDLREGIAAWVAGNHGPAVVRGLAAGDNPKGVGSDLVSLGLPALLVPETEGGLGLGLIEAVLAATELARGCVSDPLVETALVAVPWLVRREESEPLAGIARGDLRIALAHRINPWVADLDRADRLIEDGAVRDATALAGERLDSIDPLRRLFAFETANDDPLLLDIAALIAAAQLLGAGEAMLAMARDYAVDRVQFGRPIGSFQAVKHLLADVALGLEFARPVLWRAAVAMQDREVEASIHVSHAKLACSDAARRAGEHAIQVHGAMGYTYEVDLHFWMKRAWALTGAWGSRAFHAGRVERGLFDGSLPAGAACTFGTGGKYA